MTRLTTIRRPTMTAALAAALLVATLASCRDPVSVPAARTGVRALRRDVGAVTAPADAGFDPNDTQFEAELYEDRIYDVAFDSAVVDPVTGNPTTTLHIEAPPNHVLLTGGYDVSGLPRFASTDLNTQNGTGQDLALTMIGGPNDMTVYGVDGTALDATPPIGLAAGGNPLAMFGMDATMDITAGLMNGGPYAPPDSTMSGGVAPMAARPGTPSASRGALPPTSTRTALPGGGSVTRTFRRGPDGVARLSVVEIVGVSPVGRLGARSTRSLTRLRFARITIRAVPARDSARAARRAAQRARGAGPDASGPTRGPNGSGREPSGTSSAGASPAMVVCDPTTGCGMPSPTLPSAPLFSGFAAENCSYYGWCPGFLPNGGNGGCTYYTYCFPPLPNGNPMNPCYASYWGPGFCAPPKFPGQEPPNASPQLTGILLQHGLLSGRETWNWMQASLGANYGPSVPIVAFSLHWQDSLVKQSAELIKDLAGQGSFPTMRSPGQYVFVGHSQGGLISRLVYQSVSNGPAGLLNLPMAGVVTIGSPALGAPVAKSVRTVGGTVLGAVSGIRAMFCPGGSQFSTPVAMAGGCYVASRLGAFAAGPLQGLAQGQAVSDLQPGSAFLRSVSSGKEHFHRANIASYADPRWVLSRLVAESEESCAPGDLTCNGQGLVNSTATAYRRLQDCARVAYAVRILSLGVGCALTAQSFDQVDLTWGQLTTGSTDPNATTDGIVPGASQHSDGRGNCFSDCGPAVSQYVIPHGPSHVGETSNYTLYQQLQTVLNAEYIVGWH